MNHANLISIFVFAALVGVSSAAPAQRGTIAITPVTVLDGTGGLARDAMTVIVRAGRITEVHAATSARIPDGAVVIDGNGKFLIPGLWDMHVHLTRAGPSSLALFIAHGVTTVRDVGGDAALLRSWRDEIDAGRRVGPRISYAGPLLESPDGFEKLAKGGTSEPLARSRAVISNPAAADRVVDSIARLGVDFLKLRTVADVATYRAIAAAAARNKLSLVGHASEVSFEEVLRAGQGSVEHMVYPALQNRAGRQRAALIAEMARRKMVLVPTAVSYYESVALSNARAKQIIADSTGSIDPRRRYIGSPLIDYWREQLEKRPGGIRGSIQGAVVGHIHKDAFKDAKEMWRAGVHILPGSDLGVLGIYPGSSLHDELGHFVAKLGMTPMQALVSATQRSAEFLRMQDSLGTIAVGNIADLVLLDADPRADIHNTRQISAVIARGQLFDRAALDKLLHTR